jgi:hypothetical protein
VAADATLIRDDAQKTWAKAFNKADTLRASKMAYLTSHLQNRETCLADVEPHVVVNYPSKNSRAWSSSTSGASSAM